MWGQQEQDFLILTGSKFHAALMNFRVFRFWYNFILLEIKCGFAMIAK